MGTKCLCTDICILLVYVLCMVVLWTAVLEAIWTRAGILFGLKVVLMANDNRWQYVTLPVVGIPVRLPPKVCVPVSGTAICCSNSFRSSCSALSSVVQPPSTGHQRAGAKHMALSPGRNVMVEQQSATVRWQEPVCDLASAFVS